MIHRAALLLSCLLFRSQFEINAFRSPTTRQQRLPVRYAASKTLIVLAAAKKDPQQTDEAVEKLKEAALQAGADLFVALRWGAAKALTSALPDDQRQELMKRMDPEEPKFLDTVSTQETSNKDNIDDDALLMKNSVNEEVAASLAKESQQAARWEKEEKELLKQATEAANKRVETDLAIQKQRLELEQQQTKDEDLRLTMELLKKNNDDVEEEEEEDEEGALEDPSVEENEAEQVNGKSKTKTDLVSDSPVNGMMQADINGTEAALHPVLGVTLSDMGYKRIHVVSAEKLATIPVWKKQRIYRHNRAKSMAADKLKTTHLGLPGVICLHEEENGKLSIIDGQHRVGMMKILKEKQDELQLAGDKKTDFIDLDHVLVEVYPETPSIRGKDHAQDIFLEINKAEPVKLVDMPGVATAKDRNMISQAVNRLEIQYSDMFSASQRCRVPNVNVDNLRDSLFAANVIKRHNLKTTKDLLDWMLTQNDSLATKYESDKEARGSISKTAWKKASTNNFYLGLDSSWLYK